MSHLGAKPPERHELGRLRDRLTFVYVEQCVVHRADNAVTFEEQRGIVHVPAAMLTALLLGPGTRVSHAAMSLLGVCGVSAVWVGEQGVRYYAHGRPVSGSSRLAERQAALVTSTRSRLRVARAMYSMRFDDDVSADTMAQLRGREGVRMRRLYRAEAARTGVAWNRRAYDPDDYDASDPINQALTAANAALYGVVHAVIVALGCVPSLGFVHSGTDRSLVFDIADLYKAEIVLPTAFDIVASQSADIGGDTRRAVRDVMGRTRFIARVVKDLQVLFGDAGAEDEQVDAELLLWSDLGEVAAGVNYGGGSS